MYVYTPKDIVVRNIHCLPTMAIIAGRVSFLRDLASMSFCKQILFALPFIACFKGSIPKKPNQHKSRDRWTGRACFHRCCSVDVCRSRLLISVRAQPRQAEPEFCLVSVPRLFDQLVYLCNPGSQPTWTSCTCSGYRIQ